MELNDLIKKLSQMSNVEIYNELKTDHYYCIDCCKKMTEKENIICVSCNCKIDTDNFIFSINQKNNDFATYDDFLII